MKASKPYMGLLPLALESAARGILIPILSLILLNKGFTLSTLPAGLAACSIAILIFELPGGILSDRIGRKRMFLTAQVFYLTGLGLLLISQTIQTASASMMLYGIARAASSGSLDALIMDAVLEVYGKERLAWITARIGAVRAAGLALGALAGGLLYQIGLQSPFQASSLFSALFGALALTVFAFASALLLTAEIQPGQSDVKKNSAFRDSPPAKELQSGHIPSRRSGIRAERVHQFRLLKKSLLPLFSAVILMGIFICMIETYWQPRFSQLLGQDSHLWMLGLLGFCYFGVSILGASAAEPLLSRNTPERIFPAAYLLAVLCLLVLGLAKHPALFFVLYLLLYFFVSIGDMALTVSINQEIPASLRATILSLQSFLFQLGGLLGSLLCGIAVKRLSISGLWFLSAVLFLAVFSGLGILLFKQ